MTLRQQAWNGSAFVEAAHEHMECAENWTLTANGSFWSLATIPVGSTSSAEQTHILIDGNGNIDIGAPVSGSSNVAFPTTSTYTEINGTTGALTAPAVITAQTPLIDPRSPAYGSCNGLTDSQSVGTACWNAAETYMQAHGGTIFCPPGTNWTLSSVHLNNYDSVWGPNPAYGLACNINVGSSGAAFVPATPLGALNNIHLGGFHLFGGVNPIDLPLITSLVIEGVTAQDYTGNLITIVKGEQITIDDVTITKNGANGFAAWAFADCSKTLFTTGCSAAFPSPGVDTIKIFNTRDIGTINGGAGFADAWWLWSGNTISLQADNNAFRFNGLTPGVLQTQNLFNSDIVGPVVDTIGTSGTPEPIGFNIAGLMTNSSIRSYNPSFTTNWMTTQMFVFSATTQASRILRSTTSVNNASTFGLEFGNSFVTYNCELNGVLGGVYAQNSTGVHHISVLNSILSPSNLDGGQVITDQGNADVRVNLMADANGSAAATSSFIVRRAPGGFGALTYDFYSNGSLFSIQENTIPGTTNTYTMGTPSFKWLNTYSNIYTLGLTGSHINTNAASNDLAAGTIAISSATSAAHTFATDLHATRRIVR